MEKIGKLPEAAYKTVSRRSLLEWLGKAAVVAIGPGMFNACTSIRPIMYRGPEDSLLGDAAAEPSQPTDASTDSAESSDQADAQTDAQTDAELEAGNFPFEPGDTDHKVFQGWGERTVDEQDLQDILSKWKLRVDGMVENPVVLSFADLIALPRQDQTTDFHCVEGWSVYDVPWNGVHLSELFKLARPLPGAGYVTFHSLGDTYDESLPKDVALEARSLLAYGIARNTLPLKHGFPIRMVVPRLLAYKNPKYVYRIELTDKKIEGFWVQRGYPYDAEVPKTRLRDGKY